jgi:hypothetical protein
MYNYAPKKFTAIGTGAMEVEPLPPSPIDVWTYVKPAGKPMAKRAAQADAYRNIGEALYGVRISSQTTVADFMTVSDKIVTSFQGVVRGVEFVGENYRPDGIIEVTAQVDVEKLIFMLSSIAQQQGTSGQFGPDAFKGISLYYPYNIIQVTGVGVPPAKFVGRTPNYPSPVIDPEPDYVTPDYQPPVFTPYVPEWAKRTVTVTGTGVYREGMPTGQAKAMAERAAQVDAYRLLAEQVMGLKLKSETTVEDFVTTSDILVTKVNTYLRGAQIVDTRDFGPQEGIVEVDMSLYLGSMWEIIEAEYRKHIGE